MRRFKSKPAPEVMNEVSEELSESSRVRKKGAKRAVQRLRNWLYNDHPDYEQMAPEAIAQRQLERIAAVERAMAETAKTGPANDEEFRVRTFSIIEEAGGRVDLECRGRTFSLLEGGAWGLSANPTPMLPEYHMPNHAVKVVPRVMASEKQGGGHSINQEALAKIQEIEAREDEVRCDIEALTARMSIAAERRNSQARSRSASTSSLVGKVAWQPWDWLPDCELTNVVEATRQFKVRGKNYLAAGHALKGKKLAGAAPGYELVAARLLRSADKITHLAAEFPLPPKPPGAPPSILIVFRVGAGQKVPVHFALLFDKIEPPELMSTFERRVHAPGSQLGAERVKIVIGIDSPWALAAMCNNVGGQIGEALGTTQYNGDGYIEIDVDTDTFRSASAFSKLAKSIMGMLIPNTKSIQIDLGFMFHGEYEEELPERIFGQIRVSNLDLNRDGGERF